MSKRFLVIDSGNTQAKFGLVDAGTLVKIFYLKNKILLDDPVDLNQYLELHNVNLNDIDGVVLASVVPAIAARIEQCVLQPLLTIDHRHCGGLEIVLPRPEEVGADRLVNAFAALRCYGVGQIVVDFGTATTLDVLNNAGAYAGGVILPGIDLTLKTLHQATAKLPLIKIVRPKKVLGTTTIEAINQGLYWGYVSMLEGLIRRLCQEQRTDFHVVATGSYARLLAADCPFVHDVNTELTLAGLSLIAEIEWNS